MERPLLSIVFPSRNPPLLEATINNLLNTIGAEIPIEIVIKLDLDDLESIDVIKKTSALNIKWLLTDRQLGYISLCKYWYDLLNLAEGHFVVFWGDDAWIKSTGDLSTQLISNKTNPFAILTNKNLLPNHVDCFPIVHSNIIQLLKEKYGYSYEEFFLKGHLLIDGYFLGIEENFRRHDPERSTLQTFYEVEHLECSVSRTPSEELRSLALKDKRSKSEIIATKARIYKDSPHLLYAPVQISLEAFEYLRSRVREEAVP